MEPVQGQIMDLFLTGKEAVRFLNEHGLEGNDALMGDVVELCCALDGAITGQLDQIALKNKLREVGQNAVETAGRVRSLLKEGRIERAELEFQCTFVPLLLFWERYSAFFLVHGASEDSLRRWYAEERDWQRRVRENPPEEEARPHTYEFSIVVLFYGHRALTQSCLDAIKTHTRGHSYELITVDNGSDQETADWCEGLSHPKKIRYPHNMGSSLAGNLIFSTAHLYAEGKYLLYISNDVIVTPRYDEILFRCMESDRRIAMAAPLCNSASNLQAIPVPYERDDLAAMWRFAETFNHCDARKWADRARLFSILGCYRMEALQQMYLAFDPLFCYDMFADDDHSASLRRMGYRQVLCRDVFVHHYGSATIGEDQFQVMDLGRAQFYQKHGVDAWNSLGTELCSGIGCLTVKAARRLDILAVNPLFGESVLALCNRLRELGCPGMSVDALTEDARYLDDMRGMFRRCGALSSHGELLGEGRYDIVIVGVGLERCRSLSTVLSVAAGRLKSGGFLVTQHQNLLGFPTLHALLTGTALVNERYLHDPQENPTLSYVTAETLERLQSGAGLTCQFTLRLTDQSWKETIEQIVARLALSGQEETRQRLLTSAYFYLWKKET